MIIEPQELIRALVENKSEIGNIEWHHSTSFSTLRPRMRISK